MLTDVQVRAVLAARLQSLARVLGRQSYALLRAAGATADARHPAA
jgi:hypothetical protein